MRLSIAPRKGYQCLDHEFASDLFGNSNSTAIGDSTIWRMAILGSGHVPDVQVTRKKHEPERELPELFFLDKNTELRHLFIALQHAGNHQTCGSMWGLKDGETNWNRTKWQLSKSHYFCHTGQYERWYLSLLDQTKHTYSISKPSAQAIFHTFPHDPCLHMYIFNNIGSSCHIATCHGDLPFVFSASCCNLCSDLGTLKYVQHQFTAWGRAVQNCSMMCPLPTKFPETNTLHKLLGRFQIMTDPLKTLNTLKIRFWWSDSHPTSSWPGSRTSGKNNSKRAIWSSDALGEPMAKHHVFGASKQVRFCWEPKCFKISYHHTNGPTI